MPGSRVACPLLIPEPPARRFTRLVGTLTTVSICPERNMEARSDEGGGGRGESCKGLASPSGTGRGGDDLP